MEMRRYNAGQSGFNDSSVQNGNTFANWARDPVVAPYRQGTYGKLWRTTALAATDQNVQTILINSLNYRGGGTHGQGRAMDIQTLTYADGRTASFTRANTAHRMRVQTHLPAPSIIWVAAHGRPV